ncbi:hypothetical protein Tco_1411583 [Tanacetum coccineum]
MKSQSQIQSSAAVKFGGVTDTDTIPSIILMRRVYFNRMIDEKFGTLNVRLRGLEKRKERKECLQEMRNTMAKSGYL